ncbi:MAG TPA: nuclear transport factor 2 family protein [Patescibacteria group bacterium]|nr:nuclear transport factor 2 family protein [Patescibacteria group bacterium]
MTAKEQISECEKNLLKAIKSHDIDALDRMLHDGLLFNTPDGKTVTKEMDLQLHRSGAMVVDSIASSDEIISVIGDTAVVSILIETSGSILDQVLKGKFRYIRVWKLFDETWKVIGGSLVQVG